MQNVRRKIIGTMRGTFPRKAFSAYGEEAESETRDTDAFLFSGKAKVEARYHA